MILVEAVIGNANDPAWAGRLKGATLDALRLDQWQAQKNRFRIKTEGGTEIAVALQRDAHLHDGDLLTWDEAARAGVVARIELQDVLTIHLDGLIGEPAESLARTCFELGHALGNQHWPAVVKGTTVYVPLTVDRKVMASVMRTHAFVGVTHEFHPGSEVIPYLAPHEARRLFGGASATPHSHAPIGAHEHEHEHEHTHPAAGGHPAVTHSHAHSHPHAHEHEHEHEHGDHDH